MAIAKSRRAEVLPSASAQSDSPSGTSKVASVFTKGIAWGQVGWEPGDKTPYNPFLFTPHMEPQNHPVVEGIPFLGTALLEFHVAGKRETGR